MPFSFAGETLTTRVKFLDKVWFKNIHGVSQTVQNSVFLWLQHQEGLLVHGEYCIWALHCGKYDFLTGSFKFVFHSFQKYQYSALAPFPFLQTLFIPH